MSPASQKKFIAAWKMVAEQANLTARLNGFWNDTPRTDQQKRWANGNAIALMHGELSEALEGLRKGNPQDKHIPEMSSVEVELADVVLRIMDLSHERGWDVGTAIARKLF